MIIKATSSVCIGHITLKKLCVPYTLSTFAISTPAISASPHVHTTLTSHGACRFVSRSTSLEKRSYHPSHLISSHLISSELSFVWTERALKRVSSRQLQPITQDCTTYRYFVLMMNWVASGRVLIKWGQMGWVISTLLRARLSDFLCNKRHIVDNNSPYYCYVVVMRCAHAQNNRKVSDSYRPTSCLKKTSHRWLDVTLTGGLKLQEWSMTE